MQEAQPMPHARRWLQQEEGKLPGPVWKSERWPSTSLLFCQRKQTAQESPAECCAILSVSTAIKGIKKSLSQAVARRKPETPLDLWLGEDMKVTRFSRNMRNEAANYSTLQTAPTSNMFHSASTVQMWCKFTPCVRTLVSKHRQFRVFPMRPETSASLCRLKTIGIQPYLAQAKNPKLWAPRSQVNLHMPLVQLTASYFSSTSETIVYIYIYIIYIYTRL